MTRIESIRRRVLAGVALLGVVAPVGADAQSSSPPACYETLNVGTSQIRAWLDSNDSAVPSRIEVTLTPKRVKFAKGYGFASTGSPLLALEIYQGMIQQSAPNTGIAEFGFRAPALLRGGAEVPPGGASMVLTVNGEKLSSGLTWGTYSKTYEATVTTRKAATLRGVKGDLKVDFRADSKTSAATLVFPGNVVKAALTQYAPLESKLKARLAAGECRVSESTGSGGCFLTTAACDVVGLADDCWELRTLRKFRDGWLAKQADGGADIARYYAQAPAIADRLRADPRAALRLYWTRIVPSAVAAQLGLNRLARAIYSRGMRELAA